MSQRNTLQQNIVAAKLHELANHPTADQVYAAVKADYPSISIATVYLILNKMSESGSALKVRINNGADHFDHLAYAHSHIVCSVCGKVSDVEIDSLLQGIDERASELVQGYQVCGHELQFNGICEACQERVKKGA